MTRRQGRMAAGVVLVAFLVGCQVTGPESIVQGPVATKGCPALADDADIGSEGGMLSAGPYTLVVPPGALVAMTHLTLTQESCGQWPVQLGPEGTQFMVPAMLQFDASSEANPQAMTIAWWNPSTSQWVDQVTHHAGDLVSTNISHFSRWVLK
jgi:hypothetical protein